jgi:hypothetical protein
MQNLNCRQKCRKNDSSHNPAKKYDKQWIKDLPNGADVGVELALQQIRQTNEPFAPGSGNIHERESMDHHVAEDINVFLQSARQGFSALDL